MYTTYGPWKNLRSYWPPAFSLLLLVLAFSLVGWRVLAARQITAQPGWHMSGSSLYAGGNLTAAAPAALSGMIAFSSGRADYNDEIFIMNADGSRVTRLTHNQFSDREPAISPNGTKIAFVSTRDNQQGDLYLMNIDGTKVSRLTIGLNLGSGACDCNLVGPAWSPDGTKLAFVKDSEIYLRDMSNGNITPLPNQGFIDSNPAWSPDGSKIAFDRIMSGFVSIYLMNADGSNQQQLANTDFGTQPAWSPDGSKIAFVYNSSINIVNANGTGNAISLSKTFTSVLGIPRWSLDGGYIAFESPTLEGQFYPDGQHKQSELYLVDINDTARIRLTRNDVPDESPSFGPGNVPANIPPAATGFGRIAFKGSYSIPGHTNGVSGIYTINPEGWDIQLVRADTSVVTGTTVTNIEYLWPRFSADGLRVVAVQHYRRSEGATILEDTAKLAVMDADGTNETIIPVYLDNDDSPPSPATVFHPALSHDGSQIVFRTDRWKLPTCIAHCERLAIMNADGSGLRRLSPPDDDFASWNPHNGQIVYWWLGGSFSGISTADSGIEIQGDKLGYNPPTSGQLIEEGDNPFYVNGCTSFNEQDQAKFFRSPVWTGDGSAVAYVRQTFAHETRSDTYCQRFSDNVEIVAGNHTVFTSSVVNPTAPNPWNILELAWSPQNNKLAMQAGDLYVLNIGETQPKRLTNGSISSDTPLSWIPTSPNSPPPRYSIGGQVVDAQGNPVSGVTINLSGTQSATTTTDFSGQYLFSDLSSGGNYTVTPSGLVLSPPSRTFNNLSGDMTANFKPPVNCPTITVNPTNATLPAGTAGQFYNQSFTVAGSTTGYSFTISAGALPAGLNLAANGTLSGTPTVVGAFSFTVQASDVNDCTGTRAYTLTIACPAINVNPAIAAYGSVGTAYSQTFTQTGIAGKVTWGSTGALPNGLSLNTQTGLLSGTPTAQGSFNFTITASDVNNNCTGTRAYTVIISVTGLQFYPLPSPVRLLDTRSGDGITGCTTGTGTLAANATLTQAARTACSTIPANAAAVIGNITVVPSGPGYLTLFPSDATQPTVANSNFKAGEITNNFYTVGLGASDGAFKIFTSAETYVIIDLTGYYAPPGTGGLYYHPLPTPVRLVETRAGQTGCYQNQTQPLSGTGNANADPALDLQVQGRGPGLPTACNSIPNDAVLLVGNATTVFPSGGGYLTIYPSNATRPNVASSNYAGSDVINGPFAVKLGADGKFKIYTYATTHLVVDISGYYSANANDANGAGLSFNPLPKPMRLLETRPDFQGFPLTGCSRTNAQIAGSPNIRTQAAWGPCADQPPLTIPTTARALVGNVTVLNPVAAGFLTFFPGNVGTAPTVATSNYPYPVTFGYNRHYYVGLSPVDGTFKILTQYTTDMIVDVSGYFAP